ncbi:MAG: hypothetical protein R2849_05450 [Thermomicrobiales bacterium]
MANVPDVRSASPELVQPRFQLVGKTDADGERADVGVEDDDPPPGFVTRISSSIAAGMSSCWMTRLANGVERVIFERQVADVGVQEFHRRLVPSSAAGGRCQQLLAGVDTDCPASRTDQFPQLQQVVAGSGASVEDRPAGLNVQLIEDDPLAGLDILPLVLGVQQPDQPFRRSAASVRSTAGQLVCRRHRLRHLPAFHSGAVRSRRWQAGVAAENGCLHLVASDRQGRRRLPGRLTEPERTAASTPISIPASALAAA